MRLWLCSFPNICNHRRAEECHVSRRNMPLPLSHVRRHVMSPSLIDVIVLAPFNVHPPATAVQAGILRVLGRLVCCVSVNIAKNAPVEVAQPDFQSNISCNPHKDVEINRMDRPRVPVEVGERIINFLALDVETLRSCALACRSWNSRSRYHLFYSVRVSHHRSPDELVQLFRTHPEIPSFVYSVTVYHIPRAYADLTVGETVHDVAVIVLLPYLPHLTRWRFRGYRPSSQLELFAFRSAGLMCLPRYSCLESLQLRQLLLSNADLSRIVSSFPRLKNLDCTFCGRELVSTYDGGGHNIQVAASRFPRKANIQQLTVSSLY